MNRTFTSEEVYYILDRLRKRMIYRNNNLLQQVKKGIQRYKVGGQRKQINSHMIARSKTWEQAIEMLREEMLALDVIEDRIPTTRLRLRGRSR